MTCYNVMLCVNYFLGLFLAVDISTMASKTATSSMADAAKQAMEKLSAQLLCSVCLEEYRRPRVLPCLHVFCEGCLEKMVGTQHDKQRAPCPNCRKPTPLPEAGVSGLPFAFYIQHLSEVREALEKVCNPKKAQCDKCGEGEVQGFCRDCGQFICQLCLDMHRKWKELQSHEILSLEDVEEKAAKMVTPKKVTTLCAKHPTEPIKIYCETCDELICRDCTVKTHHEHNYNLISDAFPKHRDAILACLHPVKSKLASVVETITKLKSRSSGLEKQGAKAKQKVDAEIDKLHAILEGHRRDIHSEIDDKVHQGKKELGAQIDQHELRQAQLSSCVKFVEVSLQSGTQQEVLSMKRQVEQRTQQIAHEFNSGKLLLGAEKILHVECADWSRTCQTLAKVIFESQFEVIHVETISGIGSPRHIGFAATGEMAVCENSANTMTVFDSSHERLQCFGSTGSKERRLSLPRGVAISTDNTVFVAVNHCVKKFTLEGQFIASVGSQGSGELQFRFPWALAYNDTNNRVYVCDTNNNRITILNHDLTFHGSFGSKGSDAGQFNKPEGISVDSKGNVLVADMRNNRIQVFDESGRYLSSITHTTPGQRLKGPVSVAVGPDDWVYVIEIDSNRVSVFDENGEYIKSFGKRGHKDGEFNDPHAIAVSDDGRVYVSDTFNNRIQVFK